jgi:hypothetical protein
VKLEFFLAVPLLLIGVISGIRSLREPIAADDGRSRFLIAVHEASKAGFWLTLGGFFLVYGLAEEPQDWRWFALVPIAMAALRLGAAALLSREPRGS